MLTRDIHNPMNDARAKDAPQWLNRKEAAAYLGSIGVPVSARTLEKLACNNNAGKGPPFSRVRWKLVRYQIAHLEAWAKRQTVKVS
jgi:hypothetical protein